VLDGSFDEFVEGHITALDRYAYALTGDRHAAEDLVQETLIRVAGAWRRIRRDGNPTGYATTVMFRTYVSLWRGRRRTPRTLELIDDPASTTDSYAPVDARLTLRRALRDLPRLQQAVLVGTYLRDHDDHEIAEMIGRRPATVRSLRHRALKALAAALGIDEPGHPAVAPDPQTNPVAESDPRPDPSADRASTREVNDGQPGISIA
jgi:RNA polymerase sigma-70 factor (sigma-E family)